MITDMQAKAIRDLRQLVQRAKLIGMTDFEQRRADRALLREVKLSLPQLLDELESANEARAGQRETK